MGDDNSIQAPAQKLIFKTKDSSSYQPYELLADYDDPFGASDEKINGALAADSLIKKTETYLANNTGGNYQYGYIKPDISFIQYKGTIINAVTHKIAAILSVNGKDEFVQTNSKLPNIKIMAIKKDKILLKYQDENYWIKKQ